MQSNFQFLKQAFPEIYLDILEAEKHTLTTPVYGAIMCRATLEKTVKWLYANDEDLSAPYDTNLAAMLKHQDFKDNIKPSILQAADIVRRIGNDAAHGTKINTNKSLKSLKYMYEVLSYVTIYYGESYERSVFQFSEENIPKGEQTNINKAAAVAKAKELDKAVAAFEKIQQEQQKLAEENEALKKLLEVQQRALTIRKEERKRDINNEKAIPQLSSEAETRLLLIDLMLSEAGWKNLKKGLDLEYPVTGMSLVTNPSGKGYVDYVLWAKDGSPLAVVEAKSTLHSAKKGQHQAELYADCLEVEKGQRPIIYYTNGYETFIVDDTFERPRQVHGFYTQEELELRIQRRSSRIDIRTFEVDKDIAGRPYQLEAIKRVSENLVVTGKNNELRSKNREALLVMATGVGKTRTAAAMVDMFTKCNWAKRILFLADRNALVTQAKNAFKNQLPNLASIDLTKEKEDNGTRLVFSTYPTILNKINKTKGTDESYYGVGYFDVIIIDEAHRSVYNKYKDIFDYFDAILIGLTATPKKDIDKNTFELFNIEDEDATFGYELNKAVADKFLVPPKAIEVPLKLPNDGLKYKDLSDKEKEEYEALFGDPTLNTEDYQEQEIGANQINSFLFNADTVDKVLDFLMSNGIKIAGGDKIGKTILFAKNHKHAIFIKERFDKNYPEYANSFAQVIDNYNDKAQDLLEKFCDEKKEIDPQIAISVDMMDTGVDAPRVVNLIFFKKVKSSSKFWQMIGRGTRLCPNLFGPGMDKKEFVIFDFCNNFEFFDAHPDGYTSKQAKSISQQLFEVQIDIVQAIRNNVKSTKEEDAYAVEIVDHLHQTITGLNTERFEVRKVLKTVHKYKNRTNWLIISQTDEIDLKEDLSLLYMVDKDEKAIRLDILCFKLQLAKILEDKKAEENFTDRLATIAQKLEKKRNVPAVAIHLSILKNIQTEGYIETLTINSLDALRNDIRELIKFLETETLIPVYADFEDTIQGVREVDVLAYGTNSLEVYKKKVEQFVNNHKDYLVINKLYKNIPITHKELELLESFLLKETEVPKEKLNDITSTLDLGKFVRSIVGLDIEVANLLFTDFIQQNNLNAQQIRFIDRLKEFFNNNGVLDKTLLSSTMPFTENADNGILGLFENDKVVNLVAIINEVNDNSIA
ncbi:DEAD/DEAH box helicase family protein [Wenyingzhuangia sp. IMCC45533]